MLEFASASNDIFSSQQAMSHALTQALEAQPSGSADLIVVHTTMGHDFQILLDEAARLCPQAEVVGCTCGGVVGNQGASEKMRALAIMTVKGTQEGKGEYAIAYADAIRGANSREVAAQVAKELKEKNGQINMIHIMASGIDIAGDQAIVGIESVFGSDVPIFGGTSSDNMLAQVSYQFAGQRIFERGILLVGYADPTLSLLSGVHHGSTPIGEAFVVTKSEENHILELDGQPAWPRLMDALDLPVDTPVSQTLPVAGLGQKMPADLQNAYDNDRFIHTIFLVSDDRQSFYTPAAVPEGTELTLMRRDEQLMFEGVDKMVKNLSHRLGDRKPIAMFHTDCAARGRLMFNKILKDEIIARMQYPIVGEDSTPWLGLYGFGEFSPLNGKNRFHTQTSSLYAIVRGASA